MNRLLLAALSLLLIGLVPAAQAQPTPAAKPQVLLLPLTVEFENGNGYRGPDTAAFLKIVEQKAEQNGSAFDLVIPSAGDPRLEGLDLTQEPDPATAVAVAHKFDVPVVAWAKVQFGLEHHWTQPESGTVPEQQMAVGDPAPQNVLTVGGLAHLGIVDVQSGEVLMQGPVALYRSDLTRFTEGMDGFDDDVRDLTNQCAEDLAARIVQAARKSRAGQQPPPSRP